VNEGLIAGECGRQLWGADMQLMPRGRAPLPGSTIRLCRLLKAVDLAWDADVVCDVCRPV